MNRERRRHIVEVLRGFLNDNQSVIVTARELTRTRTNSTVENDPDLKLFERLDIDSRNLPIGPVRKEWNERALEQRDLDIRAFEELNRDAAKAAAVRILSKYELND